MRAVIVLIFGILMSCGNPENTKKTSIDEEIEAKVKTGKTYILGIAKKGENRNQPHDVVEQLQKEHLRFLFDLRHRGILLLGGPILDEGTIMNGMCILALESKSEAEKIMNDDPMVKSGRMTREFYTFFGIPGEGLPKTQ
ncbi:YciI family protein [bacterium]|nr:YciI family protein [bacterium]